MKSPVRSLLPPTIYNSIRFWLLVQYSVCGIFHGWIMPYLVNNLIAFLPQLFYSSTFIMFSPALYLRNETENILITSIIFAFLLLQSLIWVSSAMSWSLAPQHLCLQPLFSSCRTRFFSRFLYIDSFFRVVFNSIWPRWLYAVLLLAEFLYFPNGIYFSCLFLQRLLSVSDLTTIQYPSCAPCLFSRCHPT